MIASGLVALALSSPKIVKQPLTIFSWNIFRGGDGAMDYDKDPVDKARRQTSITDAIKHSNPDIVAMVETYGSGEAFQQRLGYHFHPRGTNVSIYSRWPILQDISVYNPTNCVGALIEGPNHQKIAFYTIWLHYFDDVWTDPKSRDGRSVEDLIAKDDPRRMTQVHAILDGINKKMKELGDIPLVLGGDFNTNSHLDYTEAAKSQYGMVIQWPVTKVIADYGFHDSYRTCNPKVDRKKDRTWSPWYPEQIQDRIDYIFWRGDALRPRWSKMLDQWKKHWPSDHSAVVTRFDWTYERS